MEYIRVKLSKSVSNKTIPVIIDGEENGIVGNVVEIEDGSTEVSVGYIGAETQLVTINHGKTSVREPLEVTINVA